MVAAEVSWGTVTFKGERIAHLPTNQQVDRIGIGQEIDRVSQQGVAKAKVSDLSAGIMPRVGVGSWLRDLNIAVYNQGVQCRIPGMAILPFAVTNQTSLTSDANISTYVAANKRRNDVMSSLGSSTGPRFYTTDGGKIVLRNTSVSNPVIVVAHTFTNNITWMGEMVVNSALALVVCTDGATDDISYTTDPTATPVVWTAYIAMSAGDYVGLAGYFPYLGKPCNAWVGRIGGIDAVWHTLASTAAVATPLIAVERETAHVANSNATQVNTGNKFPANGSQNTSVGSATLRWANPANINSDNDSYTTFNADAAASSSTPYLIASGFGFNVPTGSQIDSVEVTVDVFESNADDNIFFYDGVTLGVGGLKVVLAGTVTSIEYSLAATEIGTSEADTAVFVIAPWEASDINDGGFGFAFRLGVDGAGATANVNWDSVKANVYYKPAGQTVAFPLGIHSIGVSPFTVGRLGFLAPSVSEQATILKNRELIFLDFQWDSDGDRLVFDVTKANAGMAYVHHAVWFQGGNLLCGGGTSGPGRFLKHIDSNGALRDFAYPGVHGTTEMRINTLYAQGSWAILDTVSTDFTERQWVFWNNGKYHHDTLLQSLSTLDVTTQPLPSAVALIDTFQNRIYSIFPNSTDTGVARQYIPADLGQDPRLVSTSEVKTMAQVSGAEDTPVYVRLAELDMGPEEANKAIVVVAYQGRRISAQAGTYGQVVFHMVDDADTVFTAPEISNTFGAGIGAAAGTYNVPSAGQAYDTALIRIGLNHEAATSKSPDGLPFLITTVQQWHRQHQVDILMHGMSQPALHTKLLEFYTLADTKPVQLLKFEDQVTGRTAVFEGIKPVRNIQQAPELAQRGQTSQAQASYVAQFRLVEGSA